MLIDVIGSYIHYIMGIINLITSFVLNIGTVLWVLCNVLFHSCPNPYKFIFRMHSKFHLRRIFYFQPELFLNPYISQIHPKSKTMIRIITTLSKLVNQQE